MNLTMTIGWWAIPFAITTASFLWSLWPRQDERPTGSMFDGLAMLGPLVRGLAAAVISLIAWLIWSLLA